MRYKKMVVVVGSLFVVGREECGECWAISDYMARLFKSIFKREKQAG